METDGEKHVTSTEGGLKIQDEAREVQVPKKAYPKQRRRNCKGN